MTVIWPCLSNCPWPLRERVAPLPCDQEPVPTHGPLQGVGKEPRTAVQPVRPGQPADREEVAVDPPRPRSVLNAKSDPRRGAKRSEMLLRILSNEQPIGLTRPNVDYAPGIAQHALQRSLNSTSLSEASAAFSLRRNAARDARTASRRGARRSRTATATAEGGGRQWRSSR